MTQPSAASIPTVATKRLKVLAISAMLALVLLGGIAYVLHATGGRDNQSGERFNALIDNLMAAGVRVLELPLFMLFGGALIASALVVVVVQRAGIGRWRAGPTVLWILGLLLVMGMALLVDRRELQLRDRIHALEAFLADRRLAALDAGAKPLVAKAAALPGAGMPAGPAPIQTVASAPANAAMASVPPKRETFLFDRDAAQSVLGKSFASVEMRPIIYDRASDVVQVRIGNPLNVAYMAVIDLAAPGVGVNVGGSLNYKSLTSDYALANGCTIAINGEAGNSPSANSGLGPWRGNMMSAGKLILTEDPRDLRPFLSFTRESRATFTPMASSNRAVPGDAFNVIWGRLDALIDGVVQTEPERSRQPRTGMAIDKDGTRLYVMVVDGRQQGYSTGFTREEVGAFMKAFGAWNGMLCDEGGSSCMWVKGWGIVNSPADGGERVTYTHFGIKGPS